MNAKSVTLWAAYLLLVGTTFWSVDQLIEGQDRQKKVSCGTVEVQLALEELVFAEVFDEEDDTVALQVIFDRVNERISELCD